MSLTAIIPTYNSASLATERVQELQKAGVKRIIVCDDHSADGTVEALRARFGSSIEVIAGAENLGPGGNRNRCLEVVGDDPNELLLFLDADCQLIYQSDLEPLIITNFQEPGTGVVGFGILAADGEPMQWNFGALMHPVHEAADQAVEDLWHDGQITREQFMRYASNRAASYRMLPEDGTREVGWVAEGCFAIRSSVFRKIGGFAASMRYHETHDLNARVQEQGFKTMFCPTAVAKHLEHDSRMSRRAEDERAGRLYYYSRHWGMSEAVFKRLFDEV